LKALNALRNPAPVEPKLEEEVVINDADLVTEFIDTINKSFEERNVEFEKKVDGFHPSYTNQCARYWYYIFQGAKVTPSFSAQTYRIFDNGHAVHERIYSYFKNIGILVAEEIPVTYENPPITGTADGIIDFHGKKLIELKSISAEGFEYRRIYNKPKDDHYRQAQIYMRCLDLESAFVIYENKNNQDILPILIYRDEEFIDNLFKKYTKIYERYKESKMPKRPYKQTSPKCTSCDLYQHCWSDEDAGS